MAYIGVGPFYARNIAGQGGGNNLKYDTTPGASGSQVCSVLLPAGPGGAVPGNWVLFTPTAAGSSTPTAATVDASTAGQQAGWNFLATDFDAASPDSRVVAAQNLSLAVKFSNAGASGITGFDSAVLVYKRGAAGALTYLAHSIVSIGAVTASGGVVLASHTIAIPATTFAAGETIHIEHWGRQTTTAGRSLQMRFDRTTASANAYFVQFAGAGLAIGGTGTLTGSATLTSTGKKATAGTGTMTATGTLTSSGKSARSGTAVFTTSATMTSTASDTKHGTGTFSVTASMTSTGRATRAGAGNPIAASSPTLTSSGRANRAGSSSIAGSATLAGAGVAARSGTAIISATVTITSTGHKDETEDHAGTGTITATVTMTSGGRANRAGSSTTLAAAGVVMASSGTAAHAGGATLTAPTPTLSSGPGVGAHTGTGTITATVTVTATGSAVRGRILDVSQPTGVSIDRADTSRRVLLEQASSSRRTALTP